MHPLRPVFHTFGTFANFRLFDGRNVVEMGATSVFHDFLFPICLRMASNAIGSRQRKLDAGNCHSSFANGCGTTFD